MRTVLPVAIAALCGALSVLVFSDPAPRAFAGEEIAPSARAAAADGLVRFEVDGLSVSHDDTVSTEPLVRSKVRKIAYGRVTEIDIVTTRTGVYSSDGMASRHIRYPGISVGRASHGQGDDANSGGRALTWETRVGWVSVPLRASGSFAVLTRSGSAAVLTTEDGTCVISRRAAVC